MVTRKIGKFLRGDASPFQVYAGCILAALLGFVPGFSQAPGLIVALVALLVILNANLFLAGVVGMAAKLLGLALMPVSFHVGRFLLEGPTEGLFRALANAPVLAFFGFEYYVVTGGLVLGLLFGAICGWSVNRTLKGIWRRLAALEAGSAAFQRWSENRLVKVFGFIFLGGTSGKKSWEELAARRMGNPVRMAGLVLVLILGAGGFFGLRMLDDAFVTSLIRENLEQANGATVDLARASLDLGAGRLEIEGLEMTDPADLATNLFVAERIVAAIDTSDLLRKRAVVDSVVVTGARLGTPRQQPGRLVGPRPEPEPPSDEIKAEMPDAETLEQIFEDADLWRERLATVRRWLEEFSGGEPEEAPESGPSWEEILRARVEALGYPHVVYDGLIEGAPRLLIRRIEANGIEVASLPGETIDLHADNLSTQPALVPDAAALRVVSSSGQIKATATLPPASASGARVELALSGLDVDKLAEQLKRDQPLPVKGGTVDVTASGVISAVDTNLPIKLTLRGTTVAIGGTSARVDELAVPVVVRGAIDNPAIRVDGSALKRALVDAGKRELTNRLGGELGKLLGGDDEQDASAPAPAEDAGEGETDAGKPSLEEAAGGLLDGLLGGQKEKPTP
ncbi:MAG: hypothetical protein D6781_07295 [Verrucomicrobia bacterium]|nr:MAG: hypothetical protein D6781_07295 [Verrucomicrobiota bacterium]